MKTERKCWLKVLYTEKETFQVSDLTLCNIWASEIWPSVNRIKLYKANLLSLKEFEYRALNINYPYINVNSFKTSSET